MNLYEARARATRRAADRLAQKKADLKDSIKFAQAALEYARADVESERRRHLSPIEEFMAL